MIVNDIYLQVCDVLLEPGGLALGVLTEAQFLEYFADTATEFTQQSTLVKKWVNLPISIGVSEYTAPDSVQNVEEALLSSRYLHEETAYDLDKMFLDWKASSSSAPSLWHQDRLGLQRIEIVPDPLVAGYTIAVSADFYGTLSATSGGVDFLVTVSAPFYGTVAGYSGPIYLEPLGPVLGTIGAIETSTGNLNLVASVKPLKNGYQLGDLIEIVPDSFTQYLKWGVLAKVFSADMESKDTLRARYCQARWEEGIGLARAISTEAMED